MATTGPASSVISAVKSFSREEQSAKYALGLSRVSDADVYGEALRFLPVSRRGVTTHQYLVANYQAGMDDFAASLRRY